MGKRICFIQSNWHDNIVDQCRDSFCLELSRLESPAPTIDTLRVPGALELPLQAQRAARSKHYACIVVAGLIVDGGIYRHDFVAQSVLDHIMKVQLTEDIPIIYAVLTPHHFHGATHEQFFFDHMKIKGQEAARACHELLHLDQPQALSPSTPAQ